MVEDDTDDRQEPEDQSAEFGAEQGVAEFIRLRLKELEERMTDIDNHMVRVSKNKVDIEERLKEMEDRVQKMGQTGVQPKSSPADFF